jgi:Gas vesicle synthesis protein GvpO
VSDERSNDDRRPARPRRDEDAPRPPRDGDHEHAHHEADDGGRRRRPEEGEQPRRRPVQRPDRPLDAVAASKIALDALQTMTSRTAEGVIGVERDEDGGWLVVVELLETSRIPATADVLGEYEVEIGPDRSLRSYTRRSRYTRASTMSD